MERAIFVQVNLVFRDITISEIFIIQDIPVKLFRRRIQNYTTLCDKFIQHYATLCNPRRNIAAFLPPYRRERPFLRR